MDQKTTGMLFGLIKSAIDGQSLSEKELSEYSDEMLNGLLEMAINHDVIHLVASGMKQNSLLPGNDEMGISNFIFNALIRVEKIKFEFEALCGALEKAQIAFIPLKGSVIRELYPEDWMRTSCDIDVLVHQEDVDKAVNLLVEEYGYTYRHKGSHNASLFAPNNTHLELHFVLVEKGLANEASDVLLNVWENVKLKDGFSYLYEMSDELFYFYHIAHMAKHFENGGCGIRPFIDLWVLDKKEAKDKAKRKALLDKGKLLKFSEVVEKLSRIWFGNELADPVSLQVESYILRGGVHGNKENRIAVKQQKEGGKLSYLMSKVFIPYDILKYHYPVLEKHRWLMGAMQVRRWGKLIFCGHLKRTTEEIRYSNNISGKEADDIKKFLKDIGL